jgi:hypothetical protein
MLSSLLNLIILIHKIQHNPASNLTYPWPSDDGQMQMTTGVTDHYPTPNITSDYHIQLAQWAYSTQGTCA